jgi:hypothetical protein
VVVLGSKSIKSGKYELIHQSVPRGTLERFAPRRPSNGSSVPPAMQRINHGRFGMMENSQARESTQCSTWNIHGSSFRAADLEHSNLRKTSSATKKWRAAKRPNVPHGTLLGQSGPPAISSRGISRSMAHSMADRSNVPRGTSVEMLSKMFPIGFDSTRQDEHRCALKSVVANT